MDRLRRNLTLGLGAGVLSGCCSTASRIAPSSTADATANGLITPERGRANDTRLPVFDAHGHVFNATDLQTGGYIVGPVLNEQGVDADARRFLAGAGRFLTAVGNTLAPDTADEYDFLGRIEGAVARRVANVQDDGQRRSLAIQEADRLLDDARAEQADRIYRAMQREGFADDVRAYQRARATGVGVRSAFTPTTVREALTGELGGQPGIVPMGRQSRSWAALLEFVCQMLTYRYDSTRKHQLYYGDRAEKTRAVGVLAAMVDFQHFLDRCSAYSGIEDQILVYEKIAALTDGYLVAAAPFNPALDDGEFEQQMRVLESAMQRGAIRAVKIYPTVGYRPYGNVELGVPDASLADRERWDAAFRALYPLCLTHDVVVMTHSGHSMAPDDRFKDMSGPDSWKAVFANWPDLRVNLGHFGGGHEPGGGAPWADRFIELMGDYPNLYGDIGYWDELLAPEPNDRLALLKRIADEPLASGGRVIDRLMYGTDWMMLLQRSDWTSYGDVVCERMASVLPEDDLEAFFAGNARTLFSQTSQESSA